MGITFFNKGDPAMTDDLVLEPECKQITRPSSNAYWRLEKQNRPLALYLPA
jgi:hypothetical protein